MIKSRVLRMIRARLGGRTQLDVQINDELDMQQQTTLERNGRIQPWFMSSEVATALTTPHEERIVLPHNFAIEIEGGGLFLYSGTASKPWGKLTKDEYLQNVLDFQAEENVPEKYSISGRYFRLKPTPDQAYTLKMLYAATEDLPSTGDDSFENAWFKYAPDLVVAVVAETIARNYTLDLEMAESIKPDIARIWDRVVTETEAQANVNRSYQMGRP